MPQKKNNDRYSKAEIETKYGNGNGYEIQKNRKKMQLWPAEQQLRFSLEQEAFFFL